MSDKRIYIVYHATCPFVLGRMTTPEWAIPEYHFRSPAVAWKHHSAAASLTLDPDPADWVIVGADLTGEVNARGAHECVVDWSDVHSPASRGHTLPVVG